MTTAAAASHGHFLGMGLLSPIEPVDCSAALDLGNRPGVGPRARRAEQCRGQDLQGLA